MIRFKKLIFAVIASGFMLFSHKVSANNEMTFKGVSNGGNCLGCGWNMAEGVITSETPKLFETYVKSDHFFGGVIRLNSSGGDLSAGLELGKLFRKYEAIVEVGKSIPFDGDPSWYEKKDGICESSCAYAYLGGKERNLSEGSKLGFHQFFDDSLVLNIAEKAFTGAERLQDQYIVGVLIEYLIEMGISTELYPQIASSDPSEMTYFDYEAAEKLRIVNFRDPTSEWKFKPFSNGLVAQISKSVSEKRLRLYCTAGGKSHHLAFFLKNHQKNGDDGASWEHKDFFTGKYKTLSLTIGKEKWKAFYRLFSYSRDKSELIFVFDIPREAAKRIASSDEFVLYPTAHVPRVYSYFLYEFRFDGIKGDKRIPQIALRNCI